MVMALSMDNLGSEWGVRPPKAGCPAANRPQNGGFGKWFSIFFTYQASF